MKKLFTIVLILFSTAFIKSNAQGLVINEVDYDQPSTDSTEFIELYNSGANAVDLSLYEIVLYNGNAANSGPYDTIALPGAMLSPGSFFVICSSYGLVPLCDLSYPTPSAGFIQNGAPDAIGIVQISSGNVIDAVSYEGNSPSPFIEGTGVPIGESDTATSPGSIYRWTGISRYPDGQDSNNDSVDFHRACSTPGMPNMNTANGCLQPTAVTNIFPAKTISIYPNPTRNFVTVDISGLPSRNAVISVIDLLGNELRKVYPTNADLTPHVNLSDLSDGIYFVKVKSDSGEFMQRIVLKK
jgi:hypothetical protein